MPYVLRNSDNQKFVARKGIANSNQRMTDDIGSAQLFNTIGSAHSTEKIMITDIAHWEKWGQDVPLAEFEIFEVQINLGKKVKTG